MTMDALVAVNRYLHIAVGFCGLLAWWVPIVTAKGGVVHKRFGRLFVYAAYIVGTTAILSAPLRITDSRFDGVAWSAIARDAGFLVFLGYLGVLTIDFAHFGLRVIRTRREPAALSTPFLRALTWAMMIWSVVAAAYALLMWTPASIIMLALAPMGIMQGVEQRRYLTRPPALNKPWFYAHMDAMLGAGIAFHTAFLVFGARVFFDVSVLGPFNWVPWVLPAAVGTIGGNAWRRFYMRKFHDLPRAEPARA
jgi:hypothetical protein